MMAVFPPRFTKALRRTAVERRRLITLPDQLPAVAAGAALAELIHKRGNPNLHALFARPSLTRAADGQIRSITWYGPEGSMPKRLTQTPSPEREDAEQFLAEALETLAPLIDDRELGMMLAPALYLPSLDDILVVDGKPILTGWGTVSADCVNDMQLAESFRSALGRFCDLPPPDLNARPSKTKISTPTKPSEETKAAITPDLLQSPIQTGSASLDTPPVLDEDEKQTAIRFTLPGSVWAAFILTLILGVTYIPGVLPTAPSATPLVLTEPEGAAQSINATLKHQIAATEQIAATVCTVADDPRMEAERLRALPTPPDRLAVGTGTLAEHAAHHVAQLQMVQDGDSAQPRSLGTATLLSPTHAITLEAGLSAPDLRLQLADGTLFRIAHSMPLPQGLSLLEIERPIPGVESLVAADLPDWRDPVTVAYAPGVDALPFHVVTPGVVANGAPDISDPSSAILMHTAPLIQAQGGAVFDVCGRLLAISNAEAGTATTIATIQRALIAAGLAIPVLEGQCSPAWLPFGPRDQGPVHQVSTGRG